MRKLDETNRAEPNKKEKRKRTDKTIRKNNSGFDTKDNMRKTVSRTEGLSPYTRRRRWHLGESSSCCGLPALETEWFAVCVLMGREVNSSKTPFKFRHSYTKAFRGLFTGRCDVRWSATIQETFPPTVSLRADSNKAEKKDQHVNTKFASLYIKTPWNGITVNGVREGGGVWCVISPRSPPTPPIFPQLTPLNLLP